MCCLLIDICWCRLRYLSTLSVSRIGIIRMFTRGIDTHVSCCLLQLRVRLSHIRKDCTWITLRVLMLSCTRRFQAHLDACLFNKINVYLGWLRYVPRAVLYLWTRVALVWTWINYSQTSISVCFSHDDLTRGVSSLLTISWSRVVWLGRVSCWRDWYRDDN